MMTKADQAKQELSEIERQHRKKSRWHHWTDREKAEQQLFSFLGRHFFTSETRGLIWYQPQDEWR